MEWWTAQQGNLIGAFGGSAIGMVGAIIGSLSFLVVRGKAKPLMVARRIGTLEWLVMPSIARSYRL